jgi:integrase
MLNPARRPKRAVRKQRLTELAVRRAKPGIIWDAHTRGLALRTQPTGRKSWYCVYSRHGRPRWYRIGHADVLSLGDARTKALDVMTAVAHGKDPAAEKKAERGAGTFAELAARYVEEHAKKTNKSWPQADKLIRRYVLPRWGKLQATGVTRDDVKQLMTRVGAPILANQVLAAVSAIFTWAVREEIVPANPCKLVARNETKSRERVLAASEVPQVWKAFDDLGGVAGAALKMILLTGQRPGEVAHMRFEHIRDGWWEMPGEPIADIWPGAKNGNSHRVWIPAPAKDLLVFSGIPENKIGFVFPGVRGGVVRSLDAVMRDLCRKLGINEGVTPHDLRRTHGTMITKLGFGRDAMNRVQNHKEGGVTDVYDRHKYEVENKTVMEAVAARLMALAEGRDDGKVVTLKRGV